MNNFEKKRGITPDWVSGFCDGEGCFHISFTKRLYRKVKVEVRPSFSIVQRPHTKDSLEEFQQFFQCGSIRFSKKDGMYRYEVRSLENLMKWILPHFDLYPLRSRKQKDLLIFREICFLLHSNQGKKKESLIHIIELAYTMNSPGKRKHSKEDLLKLVMS